jgi:hypothetical protein
MFVSIIPLKRIDAIFDALIQSGQCRLRAAPPSWAERAAACHEVALSDGHDTQTARP